MKRFAKHPTVIVHEEQPFNAEPHPARLRQSFLTPENLFFSRNHGPAPGVDPEGYRLVVGVELQGLRQQLLARGSGDRRVTAR